MRTNITITIVAATILTEVGRLTNYAAIKQEKQEGDFERVATSGSDADMLQQFWKTACDTVVDKFKNYLFGLTATATQYQIIVTPTSRFNTELTDSMKENIQKFVILSVTSKWYAMTNKDDAAAYDAKATEELTEAMRKWYHKRRPIRTTPSQTT